MLLMITGLPHTCQVPLTRRPVHTDSVLLAHNIQHTK